MNNTIETLPPTQAPSTKPRPQYHLWISIMILSLFVIITLAFGILGWLRIQRDTTIHLNIQVALHRQLNELAQKINQQQQQLTTIANSKQELMQQQLQLKRQQQHYDEKLANLTAQKLPPDDVTWQLNKAAHLLQLAQLNLYWNHDISSTQLLLQQADQLIKKTELPDTNMIRQTLITAETQLAAVPQIDLLALLSKLDAISQQIPQLSLYNEHHNLPTTGNDTANTTTSPDGNWRYALQRTWLALQKIIIIRQRNQPIPPLISLSQHRLLDDSIKLMLQQAQWSLLQQNTPVYQLSLHQAITTLKQNFALNNPQTQIILQELRNLKQHNIAPTLPDISAVQIQLKEYIEQYHQKLIAHNSKKEA